MTNPSGASRVIRLLVADSNQTQSQLLTGALRRHPGFQVATCPAELSECLRALAADEADVVLIAEGSESIHGRHGLLHGLSSAYPKLALVVLLDTYNRELVISMFRAGARGLFCRASQPFKALCKCIHAVYEGQIWTNNEQLEYVIEALKQSPALQVVSARGEGLLTHREEHVVRLAAEGLSNRDMAREMKVSENTVKKSLLRIFDKLGVSNRVELVLYALTHRETCVSEAESETKPVMTGQPGTSTSALRPVRSEDREEQAPSVAACAGGLVV